MLAIAVIFYAKLFHFIHFKLALYPFQDQGGSRAYAWTTESEAGIHPGRDTRLFERPGI